MAAPLIVALVLDPEFGSRLSDLPMNLPLWVLDSAGNASAVARLRNEGRSQLTLLLAAPEESSDDLLRRALEDIDEHHGRRSGHGYDEVQVFGVGPTTLPTDLKDAFSVDGAGPGGAMVLVPRVRLARD